MTPKNLIAADFTEIRSVDIRCLGQTCGALVSIPVSKENVPLNFACPGCNTQLWGDKDNPAMNRVRALIEALHDLQRADAPKFTLGFTLDAPEEG